MVSLCFHSNVTNYVDVNWLFGNCSSVRDHFSFSSSFFFGVHEVIRLTLLVYNPFDLENTEILKKRFSFEPKYRNFEIFLKHSKMMNIYFLPKLFVL